MSDKMDALATSLAATSLVPLAVDESKWQNILPLLTETAAVLNLGEMLHPTDFSLYTSMSALELMDPRMDPGLNNTSIFPIAYRLDHDMIPLTFTSPTRLVASLEYLLTCEMAYYDGQQLTQSLYICLYLHPQVLNLLLHRVEAEASYPSTSRVFSPVVTSPTTSEEPPPSPLTLDVNVEAENEATGLVSLEVLLRLGLTAFVASLALTISECRQDVLKADLYEEEDFSTQLFGIDVTLASGLTSTRVATLLSTALDQCHAYASTQCVNDEEQVVLSQLQHLLRYRQALGQGIARLHRLSVVADLTASHAFFTTAGDALVQIQQGVQNSTSTSSLSSNSSTSYECYGMDVHIAALLESKSPPRTLLLGSVPLSVTSLLMLVKQLRYVCQPDPFTTLEGLREVLQLFSKQNPTVLPRSYMMSCLYFNQLLYGVHDLATWVHEEMNLYGVPDLLFTSGKGHLMLERVLPPLFDTLKVYLHPPSHQRAKLELMLQDWVILQEEAAFVDDEFTSLCGIPPVPNAVFPRYFTGWSMTLVLKLARLHLFLGFTLELYAPTEYVMMLWVADILLGQSVALRTASHHFVTSHATLLHTNALEAATAAPLTTSGPKAAKKKKTALKKRTAAHQALLVTLQQTFEAELGPLLITRAITRGLCQALIAFTVLNSIPSPSESYATLRVVYAHRFAAFQDLRYPSPLPYDAFEAAASTFNTRLPSDFVQAAAMSFKQVKGQMDVWMTNPFYAAALYRDEMKALVKLSVANGVTLARLGKELATAAAQGSTSLPPKTLTFSYAIYPSAPWIQF